VKKVSITDSNLDGMTIDGILVTDLFDAYRNRPKSSDSVIRSLSASERTRLFISGETRTPMNADVFIAIEC